MMNSNCFFFFFNEYNFVPPRIVKFDMGVIFQGNRALSTGWDRSCFICRPLGQVLRIGLALVEFLIWDASGSHTEFI